ncbi:hypothetical protein VOLCADRAFT_94660, partial [Volvox carteri f. nagariensis]
MTPVRRLVGRSCAAIAGWGCVLLQCKGPWQLVSPLPVSIISSTVSKHARFGRATRMRLRETGAQPSTNPCLRRMSLPPEAAAPLPTTVAALHLTTQNFAAAAATAAAGPLTAVIHESATLLPRHHRNHTLPLPPKPPAAPAAGQKKNQHGRNVLQSKCFESSVPEDPSKYTSTMLTPRANAYLAQASKRNRHVLRWQMCQERQQPGPGQAAQPRNLTQRSARHHHHLPHTMTARRGRIRCRRRRSQRG